MSSLPQQLKNLLKQIDLFSIPIPVLNNDSKSQYSSFYSGIISIWVSLLSLAYFAYVIQDWANSNILPSITSNQQALAYSEQEFENNFIQFKLADPSNNDPFKRKNNIITPLLFVVDDYKISSAPQPLFSDENKPFTVGLQKGTLIVNNLNQQIEGFKPVKNYLLLFVECLEEYLDDNSNCATQQEIDQYLSEYHGFMSIMIELQQYNFKQDQIEFITKKTYQALSPAYIQYSQIAIQQKEISIDNGILFQNWINYKLINDFYLINQSIDNKYIQNIASTFSNEEYLLNAVLAYQITIDSIQISEKIVLPKLSSVLANIGSIVQVIFMLKYLAIFINNQQFQGEIQTEILNMYYPNLKNIIIKRNILGNIIWTSQGNQNNQSEIFIKQYQCHLKKAYQKLRLINIIYELSRIELILEKHLGLENLNACRQLGSEFQFKNNEKKSGSDRASILLEGSQAHQNIDDIFTLFNKS